MNPFWPFPIDNLTFCSCFGKSVCFALVPSSSTGSASTNGDELLVGDRGGDGDLLLRGGDGLSASGVSSLLHLKNDSLSSSCLSFRALVCSYCLFSFRPPLAPMGFLFPLFVGALVGHCLVVVPS